MIIIVSRYLFLLIILFSVNLRPISMVWNFRIAQITKQPVTSIEEKEERPYTVLGLVFDQERKKYTGEIRQNYAGGFTSFIYDFGHHYFRTDFAFSHIKQTTRGQTTFSGTETDDILVTLGRNFKLNDQDVVTLSGLLGIPTHKILRLRHPDFGYSQVGLAIQLDGMHELHHDDALLYGARYVYFVPRMACDLAAISHEFTLGNIADILFAYKKNWEQHGMEFGFTERFRFGADICPLLDDTIQKTNYIRSNLYAVYKYRFSIGDTANRLLVNFAYGRDHRSKIFGNKYILTFWASWSVNF